MAPELYEATAGRIRESNTDVVLNLTTGYGGRISIELEDMNFNGTEEGEKRGFIASRDFLVHV